MTSRTNNRIARALFVAAMVVLLAVVAVFAVVMASLFDRFDEASEERRASLVRVLEEQEARTREILREVDRRASRERLRLYRSLREVLRQLGLDPSRIPPPDINSSVEDGSNEGNQRTNDDDRPDQRPSPRPSPKPSQRPSPSPTEDDRLCVLDETVCVDP